MAALHRVANSSLLLAVDSPVHSSLLVLQVSCSIGGEPGLGEGGVSQSSLLCGVDPEDGPAGWKAGLGQCLCRGWAGPSSASCASSRSPGQEEAGPAPPPPSHSLLRIGLFCHVATCICKEFQITPWFQISSKGLLPASTFVSLAKVPSSGCSICPLEGTHHLPFLPCFYKCPHLSKCEPCSQEPNLGDLESS